MLPYSCFVILFFNDNDIYNDNDSGWVSSVCTIHLNFTTEIVFHVREELGSLHLVQDGYLCLK